jgi:hypothetical protein
MRLYLFFAMAIGASFIGGSCGPAGVGDPCVPEEEYLTDFPGFNESEVNVESRSFQCVTRVCLVNHFRGRVSCPYGQSEETAQKCSTDANACRPGSPEHEISCRVPDRDGSELTDRVKIGIQPQYDNRKARDTVYCSCRCAGPDPNARYCECPSGFTCEDLMADLDIGRGQLAGSYCVIDGTSYDSTSSQGDDCSPTKGNCGYTVGSGSEKRGVNPPNPAIAADSI